MAGTTVYDVLAWGFLAFTLLFTLVLLRLWWEEKALVIASLLALAS
jgi:hypothetical protein